MKNIVLIRHGESLGQTARENGLSRSKDPSLKDCFLSRKGIRQACGLRQEINNLHKQNKFELICTSPLTRAAATCVLGLGHLSETCISISEDGNGGSSGGGESSVPFICHPDLAESGGSRGIPENQGRPIHKIIRTIEETLSFVSPSYAAIQSIDFSLAESVEWPNNGGSMVAYFMEWLSQRPETNIAVVCHHNIILALLGHSIQGVPNCIPIHCVMIDGDLRSLHLKSNLTDGPSTGMKSSTKKRNK